MKEEKENPTEKKKPEFFLKGKKTAQKQIQFNCNAQTRAAKQSVVT